MTCALVAAGVSAWTAMAVLAIASMLRAVRARARSRARMAVLWDFSEDTPPPYQAKG